MPTGDFAIRQWTQATATIKAGKILEGIFIGSIIAVSIAVLCWGLYGDPAAQPLHLSGFVCRLDNTQSYLSRYGRSP